MLPTPPISPTSGKGGAGTPLAPAHAGPPTAAPPPAEPPGEDTPATRAGIGVTLASPSHPSTQRRPLGDAEVAAFYASRDGTGDMYVHANARLPLCGGGGGAGPAGSIVDGPDVRAAWALALLRHPLLASRVTADHLSYTRPESLRAALAAADARLTLHARGSGPSDLVDAHLNGRRLLASDAPAHLALRPGLRDTDLSGAGVPTTTGTTEILLAATAYIADAASLHRLFAELLDLFATPPATLRSMIEEELARPRPRHLPPPLESRLPLSRFQCAAGALVALRAETPGQTFPRTRATRVAVAPTRILSCGQTALVLRRCAARGISLRAAIAALCAVAFARRAADPRVPIFIALTTPIEGTAIRGPSAATHVSLASAPTPLLVPALAPATLPPSALVWHRASVLQHTLALRSLPGRLPGRLHAARLRGGGALAARRALFATRAADIRAAATNPGLGLGIVLPPRAAPVPMGARDPDGNGVPLPPAPRHLLSLTVCEPVLEPESGQGAGSEREGTPVSPPVGAEVEERGQEPLESVLVGRRLPPGEVGVHAYVAGGKLTLSLGYDVNGFVWGAVEGWWGDVLALLGEVFLQ